MCREVLHLSVAFQTMAASPAYTSRRVKQSSVVFSYFEGLILHVRFI